MDEKKHETKSHAPAHATKHTAKHTTTAHAPRKARANEDSITITRVGLWQGVSSVLVILLLVSIFTGGFGGTAGSAQVAAGTVPSAAAPSAAAPSAAPSAPARAPIDMAALLDDDAVKGDADAPVTIVEFSDFECPFCGRFYRDTLGQIDEKYIQTGKVKLVYRDFPLSFHQQAQKAAEAAECAGEQDKFYEMHDLLFERGVTGGVAGFKAFAAEIGLDTAKFDTCLDTGAMASEIKADFLAGQQAGVTGTPGFIINGQLVAGAQPFSVFEQIIEAALNR